MTKNNDIAVRVEHLTKTFQIPLERSSGIKQKLVNTLKGKKGYREFTPLNNISFEIKEGEFFGIVGRNGSGKSTLLKSIAGIYTPTSGAVHVKGRLVPFIELGVGFNPELTGRENVYLNGAMLGFSNEEMDVMYDEIVEFAELGDFMDESLKNYSSGMQVRLAFSIAIRAKGDVLLLDEVLAVGDEAFQRKCYDYFGELKRDKKTVILVTHSMSHVEQFCDRAILIDEGKIRATGDNMKIAQAYRNLFVDNTTNSNTNPNGDNGVRDVAVRVGNRADENGPIYTGDDIEIEVSFSSDNQTDRGVVGINVINNERHIVYGINTKAKGLLKFSKKENLIKFTLPGILNTNTYFVNLAIGSDEKQGSSPLFQDVELAKFVVHSRGGPDRGIIHLGDKVHIDGKF